MKKRRFFPVNYFRDLDWPAQGSAIVILPVRLARRRGVGRRAGARKKVVGSGIKDVVAKEVESRSVVTVAAALGRNIDLSQFAAELGRIDSGLNFELLQGVNRRQNNIEVEIDIGIRDAIERVVAPGGTRARKRHESDWARERAGLFVQAARASAPIVWRDIGSAGAQRKRELKKLLPLERQFRNALFFDDSESTTDAPSVASLVHPWQSC